MVMTSIFTNPTFNGAKVQPGEGLGLYQCKTSGKPTKIWKTQPFIGKTAIQCAIFNSELLNYQRVSVTMHKKFHFWHQTSQRQ
jgi:hypothetical protein